MAQEGEGTETGGTSYPGWRIFAGAFVVIASLAALVVALAFVLNTYDAGDSSAESETTTVAAVSAAPATAGGKAAANGGKRANGGTQPAPPAPATTQPATTAPADSASVSASSVVAVMTPVVAGIVGLAGLFFGISATGSARGKEAEVEQVKAETHRAVVTQKLAES